jgi:hypothetical protein
MKRRGFWGIIGFAQWLTTSAFGPPDPSLLACHGRFGQFAQGQLVAVPSERDFVVYWSAGAVTSDTGQPAQVLAITPTYIDFDLPYRDYTARYRVNRIDGSVSEATLYGSVFWGECDVEPISTKF